jgi:hypothetical protein
VCIVWAIIVEVLVRFCCGSAQGGYDLQVDVNQHFDKFDYSRSDSLTQVERAL